MATTQGNLVQRFKSLDLNDLPKLTSLNDLERAFWVLWVAESKLGAGTLTPHQIEVVLRDAFGLHLPRQRIDKLLASAKPKVILMKRSPRSYKIMEEGITELSQDSAAAILIDPTQALSGLREVGTLLGELTGIVKICDPYVDAKSLDYFDCLSGAKSVRLLTANIKNVGRLKRELSAFNAEHKNVVELRIDSSKMLHDRYIISSGRMLLLGTSLNYLGRKQSYIVELGDDLRKQSTAIFDRLWASSPIL